MYEKLAGQGQHDDLLWRQLKSVPAFRALLRAVEARFYQKIDLPQPVLDVGCGDGHFAQMTLSEAPQIGIDPWWGPLRKAAKGHVYGLPLQAMGDNLPFADESFASAFSNSVLEHIGDVQPVLNEVGRVLRPGAPFVITVPSHHFSEFLGGAAFFDRLSLGGMAGGYRNLFNRISRHEHTDPPGLWAARLAEAGFRIERWQYYFSRAALRTLEIGHLQGVPSAVTHALTGHWILGPYASNLKWTEQWVRPYYEEAFPDEGAYIFFLASKVRTGPIQVELPEAEPFSLADFEDAEPIRLDSAGTIAAGSSAMGIGAVEAGPSSQNMAAGRVGEESAAPSEEEAAAAVSSISVARQPWLYVLGLILAIAAPRLATIGSTRLPWLAIATWLAAAAVGFYALNQPQRRSETGRISTFTLGTSILLFLLALAVRLYHVAQEPFILNGTETSLGLDALGTISGTISSPFSSGWLTNPTLPLYLMAIPLKLLGPSALSLRLLSPFAGAATVVATYLLGQRLYGRAAGLAAGILLLGSYFHVHYSRLGLTNAWDGLLVLLSLGFVAIAWRQPAKESRLMWLAAGVAIGLSAYLLSSSHLLPLMLLGLLVWSLIADRRRWGRQWRNFLAMAALALLIALPQMLYYAGNAGVFMERAQALGILDSQSGWLSREAQQTGQSELALFGQQLSASALAFHATLDSGTSFGPPKPLLNLFSGVLLVIGLGAALLHWRKIEYSMLVIWLGVTILFAGALLVSPPNSQRYIIAAPAVSLLAAVGLVALVEIVFKGADEEEGADAGVGPLRRQLLLLAIPLVIAAALAVYDIGFYFGRYQQDNHFGDRNTEIADRLGRYLNSLDGEWSAYFYGAPSMYVDFPTIPFLAQGFEKGRNLFDVEGNSSELPPVESENQVLIFLPERLDELAAAKEQFSSGEEVRFDGTYAQPLFVAYEIKE